MAIESHLWPCKILSIPPVKEHGAQTQGEGWVKRLFAAISWSKVGFELPASKVRCVVVLAAVNAATELITVFRYVIGCVGTEYGLSKD